MRPACLAFVLATLSAVPVYARVVVFQEPGFPVVDSQSASSATLRTALGPDAIFAGIASLSHGGVLQNADLLVLPYGSAVPVAAWDSIDHYLQHGGNILILGGRPLAVPVSGQPGNFKQQAPQYTYSRVLDFLNMYTAPLTNIGTHFAWRSGYSFLPDVTLRAQRYFVVEGRLNGLGYMEDADGDKVAAPVIVSDHLRSGPFPGWAFGRSMPGSRVVALDFDPQPGYWQSSDGIKLIRSAAEYAEQGATQFWIEEQYATLRPGELPLLTLHLRRPGLVARLPYNPLEGLQSEAQVALYDGDQRIDSITVMLHGASADAEIPFRKPLTSGFYTVRAVWSAGGEDREYYANGFRVEDISALGTGPALGVKGDFLTLGGKPFLPIGTNYFGTEENGWDFSGPRNALVWERDFADMERHNVTLVRTGVWMSNAKFVEPLTGEVNERFLRNLEAFLAAAHDHHIAVNFTFFAFVPRVGETFRRPGSGPEPPSPNPYLNPATVHAEQEYVLSVVHRFGHIPWLCWDLINEPSFSNPHLIFHGNVPNGDPDEIAAWHRWLQQKYVQLDALSEAWSVPDDSLHSFDDVPLPTEHDLTYSRYGNQQEVRALDYNLFAQGMFSHWVRGMVKAIRGAGSSQLINIGQDEGGVMNRVLNQFYATSGVSFTTNHTYWNDNALLWDSVAAKYPGIPNITGETGYQPVWEPDGTWRYDELTGSALIERKWALGFAAGSSGAMQWDWDREVNFGMERSDGSAKLWEGMMADLGHFAKEASPWATGWIPPQVAIVLPQSLQLSVYDVEALKAQQVAVRVLFNYDHSSAYTVGEYQINTLGNPRLIILPAPLGLTDAAWKVLEKKVRNGATLLISGPFAGNAHLHPTDRATQVGLAYEKVPLELRNQTFHWAGKPLPLVYSGMTTTSLERAQLPDDADWKDISLGKGHILFSALPLELNDRLDSVAAVYAFALKLAGVQPVYSTTLIDPGILICPTLWPHATLYVLTSETNNTMVSFHDERSGMAFAGTLEPGHAALLLVGDNGKLLASYRWHGADRP